MNLKFDIWFLHGPRCSSIRNNQTKIENVLNHDKDTLDIQHWGGQSIANFKHLLLVLTLPIKRAQSSINNLTISRIKTCKSIIVWPCICCNCHQEPLEWRNHNHSFRSFSSNMLCSATLPNSNWQILVNYLKNTVFWTFTNPFNWLVGK